MSYDSKNWVDWIYERFNDNSKYSINVVNGIEYYIKSNKPHITTVILFQFLREDDKDTLYDIQFCGNDCETEFWLSPFTIDTQYMIKGYVVTPLYFTNDFVNRLENEWLYIPLKTGWKEKVFVVDNVIYESKLWLPEFLDKKPLHSQNNRLLLSIFQKVKTIFSVNTYQKDFTFLPIE